METVSMGQEGALWVGAEWGLVMGPAHNAVAFPS